MTRKRMHGPLCCERIEVGLAEYLEGRLPESLNLRFESHLRTCVECWRDLQRIRDTLAYLAVLPRQPMPESMKERLVLMPRGG